MALRYISTDISGFQHTCTLKMGGANKKTGLPYTRQPGYLLLRPAAFRPAIRQVWLYPVSIEHVVVIPLLYVKAEDKVNLAERSSASQL